MRMIWSRHKDSAKTSAPQSPSLWRGSGPRQQAARGGNPRRADLAVNSPSDTVSVERAARSTGGGNLLDEIADAPLDFVARQAVARLGVGQAEIAADDKGAQPFAGQVHGLLRAEAAHHLYGRPVAYALENRARHVVQGAALKQCRVRPPGVVLQVNDDAIDAGVEHALRRPARRRGRALHRNEDVSEGKSRDRRIGPPERIAHRAHSLGRRLAGKSEEVDDVAAAAIDRVASPSPPSMVFMSASSSALGNRCRKIGTTLRTPSYFKSGVPSSRMVTPAASAASATASPCVTWAVSTEIWNVKCSRNRRRTRFDSLETSFIMASLLLLAGVAHGHGAGIRVSERPALGRRKVHERVVETFPDRIAYSRVFPSRAIVPLEFNG